MNPDIQRLIKFYRSGLGGVARRFVRNHVHAFAGDVQGKRILGLGFATPYLRFSLTQAESVVSAMPGRQGVAVWPREGPTTSILCDPLELPLNDSSVDLIVAVHALEFATDAEEMMRELWRVAAPDAHLIAVLPRRNGIWAARDNTPFGQGNPYTVRQLNHLLRQHSFEPLSFRHALYMLPSERRIALKFAKMTEKLGPMSGSALSGVICAHARKKQFPAVLRRKRSEKYIRVPEFVAQPAFQGVSD